MPSQAAFFLQQTLDVKERETDQSPVRTEAGPRQSLLLLDERTLQLQWQRGIEEFILTPEQLQKFVAGKSDVKQSDLRDLHRAAIRRMKVPVGLQIPLILQTDPLNHDPGQKSPNGKTLPASYQALLMPTFLPELPKGAWDEGTTWEGKAQVRYGVGQLWAAYVSKIIAKEPAFTTLQIDLLPQPSSFAKDGYSFVLQPSGSITLRYAPLETVPLSAKGKLQIIVQGKLTAGDAPPREAELLNYRNEFEYAQIPISHNDTTLNAIAWRPAEKS